MAFRIITELPRPGWARRLGRGILPFAAQLLAMLGFLIAVAGLPRLATGLIEGKPDDVEGGGLFLAWGAPMLLVGVLLIRGRRQLVLFLRRFGLDSASDALTHAVRTSLGHRWRLVSLDDARLEAVGTLEAGEKRKLAIFRWSTTALTLYMIIHLKWIDPPGFLFKHASAFTLVVFVVGAISLFVSLWLWGTAILVRIAERARVPRVAVQADIARTASRVRRYARRIFAPRLMVIHASDRIWRDLVIALAGAADTAVIDVSDPSENLLWEIEALHDLRQIYVGDRAAVEQLASPQHAGTKLSELLDGRDVIVYDDASSGVFAAALAVQLRR